MLPGADPVFKVTIVPRGMAGGVTAFQPDDDRRLYSKEFLFNRMVVGLGGRAAEEIAIGEITTGASNDLQMVTATARRMVSAWGMSEDFGLLNFGDDDRQPFLGYSMAMGRSYSEETASKIDSEIRRLVERAHTNAIDLLRKNRGKLDSLANELLTTETVDRDRVLELVGIPDPMGDSDEGVVIPNPEINPEG